jgi:hypothetical protein
MYKKLFLIIISLSFLLSAVTFAQRANIEGTYRLVVRKLPDGTRLTAPNVMGLMTFTKTHRNFNVAWVDKDGKHFSYSVVSTYKLTDTEYTETIIFSIMNDEIAGKGLTYVMSGDSSTVPVKVADGKIEINPPFDQVTMVFDGNRLVGTSEGNFKDYWEKIE